MAEKGKKGSTRGFISVCDDDDDAFLRMICAASEVGISMGLNN